MHVSSAQAGPTNRSKTLAAALAAALVLPFATTSAASANGDLPDPVTPDIITQEVASPTAVDEVEVVVVHGIPGVDVDVLIDGGAALTDVSYTDIAVLNPDEGTYDIAIATPGTTDVIAGLEIEAAELSNGVSYTVAAHLDAEGVPTLAVFENETAATGIEVFHLADFIDVAIVSDGTIVADDLANGSTAKLPVDGGTVVPDVGVAAAGETDAVIALGDVPVAMDTVLLVYAVGPVPAEEPEPEPEPELPPLPEVLIETVDVPTSTDGAQVVIVHAVPDLVVDVLVDGAAAVEGFEYGETVVTTLTAGTYDLGVAAAGSDEALLELDAVLEDGDSVTVAAYLDADGEPTLATFVNETDSTGVQAFHLAEFPAVALLSGDMTLADPLASGETVKLDVDGGETVVDVGIGLAGTTDAAIELDDVDVPADTLLLVYAVTPQADDELPFSDIEGNTHLEGILALAEAGVIGGFEDGTFGPGLPIRRDQMATFMAKALELEPSETDPTFVDIAGNTHEANIRAIAAAGITLGVGDDRYDPSSFVPRGQMATFLANGFDLEASDDAPTFSDIAGTTHEDGIRAIAEARITGGFEDGTFGPDVAVTRAQMSTFVARALGLIDLAPAS